MESQAKFAAPRSSSTTGLWWAAFSVLPRYIATPSSSKQVRLHVLQSAEPQPGRKREMGQLNQCQSSSKQSRRGSSRLGKQMQKHSNLGKFASTYTFPFMSVPWHKTASAQVFTLA